MLTSSLITFALLLPALPVGQYFWVHPTLVAWRAQVFGPGALPGWPGSARGTAAVIERYISGAASEAAMREAIVEMLSATCAPLDPMRRFVATEEPIFISGGSDNEDTRTTERLLRSTTIDPERHNAILDAIADAYAAVPMHMTCAVESAIIESGGTVRPAAGLTDAQRRRFAHVFLDIHAQPDRPWSDCWGLFIEDCFGRGLVTQDEFAAYLGRMLHCKLALSAENGARVGDTAYLYAAVWFKGGCHLPVRLRIQPANPSTAESLVGAGTSMISGTRYVGSGIRGRMILPGEAGEFEAAFVVTAEFGPDVIGEYKSSVSGDNEPDPAWWPQIPSAFASRAVSRTIALVPSVVARPEFGSHGVTPVEVVNRVQSLRVDRATIDGRQHVRATIGFQGLSVDLSMDASIKQGDMMIPLGWSCTDRFSDDVLRYQAVADLLDAEKPFVVVLTPNTQRVGRPEWNRSWWDGAVGLDVCKATTPRKGDLIDPSLSSR